jgi:hypothetical protein
VGDRYGVAGVGTGRRRLAVDGELSLAGGNVDLLFVGAGPDEDTLRCGRGGAQCADGFLNLATC